MNEKLRRKCCIQLRRGAEMAVKITSVGTNIPTKLVIIHSFRKRGKKG